ncbi:MAG: Rgg/GadR/MutR family transcriptional regulator [Enterococcus sp.]
MIPNIISQRTTLSSFERNGTRIAFEILSEYLQRMNITLEEYEYLLHSKELTQQRGISSEVMQKVQQPFEEPFSQKLLFLYHDTGLFFYYSLYAQYCLVRHHLGDSLSKSKLTHIERTIKDYLDSIETWGRFELVLFSNCLFLFSDTYINFQFREAVQQMRLYKDSAHYSTELLKFVINGLNLSFERGATVNLKLFKNELERFITLYDDLKAKLILKIFNLLLDHQAGSDNNKEKIELLLALELLDEPYWIEYLERHY